MRTLREANPGAADMWCYDLNGDMTPDNVSFSSDNYAYFRCIDNPKHLFHKKIRKMTSERDMHNIGCIYCGPNAKITFPGETDFFTKVPEAVHMWDFAQNNLLGLVPEELLPYSSKKAHFICVNGHDEFRKISDFTKSPSCQTCNKSLLINAPSTSLFLNEKYNTIENLKDYIQSDKRVLKLACPYCDYTWSWTANLWCKRQYCPHCGYDGTEGSCEKNTFVKEMYHIVTLRDANPEMAVAWNYEKNGDATPDNTRGHSNHKFFFKCANGHDFDIELYNLYDKDGSPIGCPFCRRRTRIATDGINDLETKVSKILEFWDFESNDISPDSISAQSSYEAKFKCPKGHRFTRKVCLFSADPQCKECKKLEHLRKYSIKTSRPESYKFWDFKKNTLDPSITSAYSKEEAFWKCSDCGYEWVQSISDRCSSRGGKCPSHDLKRSFSQEYGLQYSESFACMNPAASQYWNRELSSGLTPENTPKRSGKEIYMNCSRGKHKPYPIKVCNIKKTPFGCPECQREDREESYKQNSLKLNVPAAVDMWDYANNKIELDDALLYMNESVNFICEEGHPFSRSISAFVNNQECPVCKMDTIAKHPHMVKQWHFKKNTAFDINLTPAGAKDTVWWKCKKCGYEWQSQINTRKVSAGHCPCCEERVVVVKGITDLFTMVPDIKEFYDFDANIGINPNELSVTSRTKVNWKCDSCGYKWITSVGARIIYDKGTYRVRNCPSCIGLVRNLSYGEEYPELAEKFADELNICSLFDIVESKYQDKNYLWHCDICDEVFESTIYAMIRSRNTKAKGCSYCAGKKVTRENSFAALHPEVMDEFDLTNEIDPYSITERSNKSAKWICRNNPEHRWVAKFSARAKGQGGCNICRGYNYGLMFADIYPEYEKYYDKSKNNRPFNTLAAKSNDSVWWTCDKGHSFHRIVCHLNVAGEFRCPVCTGRIIVTGENDLLTEYPELESIWDYSKNDAAPTTLSPKTNDKYYFKCEKGHSYATYLNTLIDHDFKCFVCDNVIVQEGVNSLLDTNPVLCKEISKNEPRNPTEFTQESASSILWECPDCHGEYRAVIRERSVGDDSCPFCNGRRTQLGINSLMDTHPLLAKEYSNENNFPIGEIRKTHKKWVKWDCPNCSGTYSKQVCEREVGDDSCPYCKNEQLLYGFNGVAQTETFAISEWADSDVDPSGILATSNVKVDWECEECGGIYREPIKKHIQDYYNNFNDCPYCNNRRPLTGLNTLETVLDDIVSIWSTSNDKHYSELLPSSGYDAEWKCNICNGLYKETIYSFVPKHLNGEDDCPYCKKRKPLAGFNTLKVKCEKLMREWNYRSNYLIANSDAILPTYPEDVWWTCECGKNYKMSPKKRLYYQKRHMKSCPYCKGRRRKKHRHF